jgi:hypothetical protein
MELEIMELEIINMVVLMNMEVNRHMRRKKTTSFHMFLPVKRIANGNLNDNLKDWCSMRDEVRMKLSNKEDLENSFPIMNCCCCVS